MECIAAAALPVLTDNWLGHDERVMLGCGVEQGVAALRAVRSLCRESAMCPSPPATRTRGVASAVGPNCRAGDAQDGGLFRVRSDARDSRDSNVAAVAMQLARPRRSCDVSYSQPPPHGVEGSIAGGFDHSGTKA
eukprot:1203379-Rhodomonas_salina.1